MSALEKLIKIRNLEKQLAEASLIAAEAEVEAAGRRLAELGQQRASLLGNLVRSALDGDFERAHLGHLSLARAQQDERRVMGLAAERQVSCQLRKDEFMAARLNHSMLEFLLQHEARQRRILGERREQKSLDEAYRMRRLRTPGSIAIPSRVRLSRP